MPCRAGHDSKTCSPTVRPRLLSSPRRNRVLHGVELSVEEVARPRDDDELARRRQRLDEGAQRLAGAEVVPLALHEEARLGRPLQHARVAEAHEREAEREHRSYARVPRGDAQRHDGAEREAAQHERRSGEAPLQLRERGARVLLLAVAVVVDAFAATHAAEVEAQHGEALLLERLRGTEHDLEVHHPAVQRVRVADDGRGHGRRLGAHQDRFETADGSREVEGLAGRHQARF